jgi:hypothetical protein
MSRASAANHTRSAGSYRTWPAFRRSTDAITANAAIFAITAHADEREAHVREVEQFGQTFPEGSFGRQNRQAIAAREGRVAARLRAVERAYRMANDCGAAFEPPESTKHGVPNM